MLTRGHWVIGRRIDMKIIWQTEFRCDTCQRMIEGQLVCEPEEESPQHEKSRGIEHLRHNHKTDARASCWKCKRQIETHEIENLIWANDSWQDLCKKCLEGWNWSTISLWGLISSQDVIDRRLHWILCRKSTLPVLLSPLFYLQSYRLLNLHPWLWGAATVE